MVAGHSQNRLSDRWPLRPKVDPNGAGENENGPNIPSVFPYPCYYLVHALSSLPAGRTMLDQAIWRSTIALELLLFVRGFQSALVSRYPVFYTYISFVLLQELLRFSVYRWDSTRD